MASAFWDQVKAEGLHVPPDRPLDELTTELTAMLGDTDPHVRHGIAHATLTAWISAGVYDDLLQGLGDGMAAGLAVGIGDDGTETVFRRGFSAAVLAQCIRRDNSHHLVPADTVLGWGDRLAGWFVRERDLRAMLPGKGWAHAVAHGADALGALAESKAVGRMELTVLLDVIADRLLAPTPYRLVHGESDRLAAATLEILRRDLLAVDVLEPWVARLAGSAAPHSDVTDTDPVARNVQGYLRALHLQLALGARPPACRADLLLIVIDHLRATNAAVLGSHE